MKKSIVLVPAVLAGIAVLAVWTNPAPEKHRDRIKEAVAQRSPLAAALGVGALTAFMSSYHSVGVASYTVVNDKTVSVGVAGMVFVLD